MYKFYKIMFLNFLIMGTLISISSYSWFSMWMGLEINLLSIIPLLSSSKNSFNNESSIKYFLSQALASLIIIFSVISMLMFKEFIGPQMNSFMLMLNTALMMKMGAAPFHFWFPEVMKNLNWFNCSIMLTWQKIAPMILLMNNTMKLNYMMTIISMSLIISSLLGFNQTSLRKIMAYSSINHIGWMLTAVLISNSIWMNYFFIYSFITFSLTLVFHFNKIYYFQQLINLPNISKINKFILMLNFMSLGGLPPFLGFLPKWMTINYTIFNNMFMISFILIITTMIFLYIYVRMMFTSMIILTNESKFKINKNNKFIIFMLNYISLSSLPLCTLMYNFN